jgi:hypothetical protein
VDCGAGDPWIAGTYKLTFASTATCTSCVDVGSRSYQGSGAGAINRDFYITGYSIGGEMQFFGRYFEVTPAVLIPRPETEFIVESVLEANTRMDPTIIDVGTGSGCISVTLALELAKPRVFATDVSMDALFVARNNSRQLGAQVEFACADLLDGIGGEDPLWQKLIHGLYLGTESWAKEMRVRVESKPRSTDHPTTQRAIGRPTMSQVITAVARAANRPAQAIRTKRGDPLRALVAWIGWHEGWITLRSIAAALRLRSEGHISTLIRRCDRMLASDSTLLGHLDAALALTR